MEYLTCISIPTPDVEYYGRPVGDMVRKGARVQADGIVKGRFPYVTGYIGFSANEPDGHYFPARLNVSGKKLEIVRCKDGKTTTANMENGDDFIVIKMDENKEFDLRVDGKKICHLDFSEAILEEKKGESKMNAGFFDPGVCGLMVTGHIGSVNKDSKASEAAVVFDNALPVGTRMVYVVAIASDDYEGTATIDVGDGTTEKAYADAATLTKGKATVVNVPLSKVNSHKASIKLSAEPTKGSVDVFATVIRLEV